MHVQRLSLALSALALATASFAASAGITFTHLGTNAPPATLGSYVMTPFDTAPQEAIEDFTDSITLIPGSPIAGDLGIAPGVIKYTVGDTWYTPWAHGFTGPVFLADDTSITLTLPPNTHAFYFYIQGNNYGTHNISATTDGGGTSGPIPVLTSEESDGATGFAFHATAGETLSTITITAPASAFGVGLAEFGVDTDVIAVATCASSGYTGTKLLWCQKICESGLTGKALEDWIHRWINRYRELPTCAAGGGGEGEGEGEGA